MLTNGRVLITDGNGPLASAELYNSGEPVGTAVARASYLSQLAAKAIVSAFGQNFFPTTVNAANRPLTASFQPRPAGSS